MYSTLPEYLDDLEKVKSIIDLTSEIKEFCGYQIVEDDENETNFFYHASNLHARARVNHSNIPLLNGTLILFIAGKFEKFIRSTFEELCINIIDRSSKFQYLPKEMKLNLIKYAADVISNPRKFGHAEAGVKAFVKVLAVLT